MRLCLHYLHRLPEECRGLTMRHVARLRAFADITKDAEMSTITLEDIVIRLSASGTDKTANDIKKTTNSVDDVSDSARKAGDSFNVAKSGVIGFLSELTATVGAITGFIASVGALSGVKLAAQYQRIELGFSALLGSAEKAKALMKDLVDLGQTTPFQTVQLVDFSKRLLATGSTAAQVTKQMRILANFGGVTGKTDSELGGIVSEMAGMRFRQHLNIEEIGVLGRMGIDLRKVTGAATGHEFKSETQAQMYLAGMSGPRAFETILKGLDVQFGKVDVGAGTFLGILENLQEAFQNIMLPTGKLLLGPLSGLAKLMQGVAGFIGWLNQLTGGMMGLVSIVYGLIRAKNMLVLTYRATIGAVTQLIAKMEELAAATSAAAAATGSAVVANAAVPAASAAGSVGLGAALLKFVKNPTVIGIAIDIIGNLAGGAIGGRLGSMFKGIGTGVGFGSLGNIGGPEIGIPAMIIGGVVGGIWGLIDGKEKPWTGGDDPASRTADATERIAADMADVRGQLIGGGSRARRVAGDLELEYSLARLLSI